MKGRLNISAVFFYPSHRKYANMDPAYDYENDSYLFEHAYELKSLWLFVLMLPHLAYVTNFVYGIRSLHDNVLIHLLLIILDVYYITQAILHLTESIKYSPNSELIFTKFFRKRVVKLNDIERISYSLKNSSFLFLTKCGNSYKVSSYLVGLPMLVTDIARSKPHIFDGTQTKYLSVLEES